MSLRDSTVVLLAKSTCRVDTFKGSCWLQRVEIIVLWNCPSVFFLLLFIIFSKIVYNYSSGLIPNIYGGS